MREHVYCCVSAVIVTEAAPFSWWVGGPMPGQVQLHWGGALPGGRQCACGTQGNCLDHHHYCNCDADYDQWWWYFFVHLSSVVQNLHIKTVTVILGKQQWVAQQKEQLAGHETPHTPFIYFRCSLPRKCMLRLFVMPQKALMPVR